MTEGAHKTHPNYWAIWGWLLGLTVAEVFVAQTALPRQLLVLLLLAMAVWKALLVALYFMHLRFEGNRMRIFAIAPLPLTVIVVVAVLMEFV
jgi:cytochrome c oxidase subunit 4